MKIREENRKGDSCRARFLRRKDEVLGTGLQAGMIDLILKGMTNTTEKDYVKDMVLLNELVSVLVQEPDNESIYQLATEALEKLMVSLEAAGWVKSSENQ